MMKKRNLNIKHIPLIFSIVLFGFPIFYIFKSTIEENRMLSPLRRIGLRDKNHYKKYYNVIDQKGCTLRDILYTGNNRSSTNNIIAVTCSPDDYISSFKDVMKDIIIKSNKLSPGFNYINNFDHNQITDLHLDQEGNVLLESRISVARNIQNFSFRRAQDIYSVNQTENIIMRGFSLAKSMFASGKYFKYNNLSIEERNKLIEMKIIPNISEPKGVFELLIHNDTKEELGVIYDKSMDFFVTVNGDDHFIATKIVQDKDFSGSVKFLFDFIDRTELLFAHHPEYGYLTSYPQNAGSGLTVRFKLKLPKLSSKERKLKKMVKKSCLNFSKDKNESDIFFFENKTKVGISEVDIINKTILQIAQIIELEKSL